MAYSQQYSRARIYYNSAKDLALLSAQGVALDHLLFKRGVYIESDFSSQELGSAKMLGLKTEILIEDVVKFYSEQNSVENTTIRETENCFDKDGEYKIPTNWKHGSMGGYFKYQEFLDHLDLMADKYPHLITKREPISNFKTSENRHIYFVKISDNPNEDENESTVLYNAIHHGREPASLSQTIFYMWYLLENYEYNAEIKGLVDNLEMYFVPVINPDGYIYNEKTQPNGGGMWRKNRRGGYGVDPNRNYDYEWGGVGASASQSQETYRGSSSFSEPETKAMKWLCEQHDFKIAMNAHCASNVLLYPWGYTKNASPDQQYYHELGAEMCSENNFEPGQGSIIMYPASGNSDDWMYMGNSKPKIISYTPEIGSKADGFWPAKSKIDGICKGMVKQNKNAANASLNWAIVKEKSPLILETHSAHLSYSLKRLGLENGKDFKISIKGIGPYVQSVGSANTHSGVQLMASLKDSISYTMATNTPAGQKFQLELHVDNGYFVTVDTITKYFGSGGSVISESGDNMSNWNGWDKTSQDYYSAPSSVTDSPHGNYSNSNKNDMVLLTNIDLSNVGTAQLRFWAKWDIEDNYDYAQVMASTDGGSSWTALCGQYTVRGGQYQDQDQPVYDGKQSGWVREIIDLSNFLGEIIKIKFRVVSDMYTSKDGFYLDDFEVLTAGTSSILESRLLNGMGLKCWPNPANDQVTFGVVGNNVSENSQISIINNLGEVVDEIELDGLSREFRYSTKNLGVGVYFCVLSDNKNLSLPTRLVISK